MLKRRDFLKTGALSALAPLPMLAGEAPISAVGNVLEPSRNVPLARETDVIVCGGGPAGFAAALSAARSGAKTTLIEVHGFLGGVWTASLLSNIIDAGGKPGIMRELIDRLNATDAQYTATKYDAELMKWTLEQMCQEAGVDVRLHTRVTAAYRDSTDRIDHIMTESFSGREAWKAKIFIDTTGNGELAARAGCQFDVGEPGTGRTQPMSLMVILSGLNESDLVSAGYIKGPGKDGSPSEAGKKKLHAEILKTGIDASYTMPSFFSIRPDMVALMVNHQYGVSALDAGAVTRATLEARHEVNRIVDALRQTGGMWANLRIVTTAAQIGIREGRRIHGRYTLTREDLLRGAQFEDGVCQVNFVVDIHSLVKGEGGGYGSAGVKMKPYQIPLRALIANDVANLMMAGRCISGDFYAHASYRVTGNAVPMGEAAGKVAAKAALTDRLPKDINWTDV
ncbi:MAG: FAD-dependent oxidoreductase [Sphingobacteriaceae bacterium]|nr:FAD-dependent oxidoreductase [Cytophagaceae bacterium]